MFKAATLFLLSALIHFSFGETSEIWKRAQAIPIQFNGREMPFETAAQEIYYRITGRATPKIHSATQWLCELSNKSDSLKLFSIPQNSVKSVLKLQGKRKRYSYSEIARRVTVIDHTNYSTHQKYSILKMRIDEIYGKKSLLEPSTQQGIINLYNNLCLYEWLLQRHKNFAWSSIQPIQPFNPLSPFYNSKYFSVSTDSVFSAFNDVLMWRERIGTTSNSNEARILFPSSRQAEIELLYMRINPVRIFLTVSIITLFILILFPKSNSFSSIIPSTLLFTEFLFRALILQRFPIASLYETILLSSLILLLYSHFKRPTFFMLASALLLERVGFYFSSEQSLEVISSQLRNNFWLSTHVTCIIIGISLLLINALLAHFTISKRVYQEKSSQNNNSLLVTGFLCLLVGTILGSLWAKESWGRYWDWDPKEIGALVLLIYSAGLLTYKRLIDSSHFYKEFFSALMLPLILIVWLGTNTMSTSIHSYGYSKSGLFIFLTLVSIDSLFLIYHITQRKKAI